MVASAVIIVSIVISVVVAGVTVVIAKLVDKDSNSMDKVRRYSNKRVEEFENFFDSNLEKLNGLSADLETHQATAIAAVRANSSSMVTFSDR